MVWQMLGAGLVVTAALGYLTWRSVRAWQGSAGGCGKGCGCGKQGSIGKSKGDSTFIPSSDLQFRVRS